jgi:hypothetical protein
MLTITVFTSAVFLVIGKAFDNTCHAGLLFKSSVLKLVVSMIDLFSPYVSDRKFKVAIEAKYPHLEKCKQGYRTVPLVRFV